MNSSFLSTIYGLYYFILHQENAIASTLLTRGYVFVSIFMCWETVFQLEETSKCKHEETKNTTEIHAIMKLNNEHGWFRMENSRRDEENKNLGKKG